MKKPWQIMKRSVFGLLGLILLMAVGGFSCRTYRLHELAKSVQTPNGINEALFVKIGGIDQWITIRGQNRDNPVVLFLHGGRASHF
jgi:hypothetical protein